MNFVKEQMNIYLYVIFQMLNIRKLKIELVSKVIYFLAINCSTILILGKINLRMFP